MVCMLTENKTYTIMYVPWLKMAVIPDSADVSSEKASEMLFEIRGYQYEKNSKEALSDAVASVNGFIEKMME